MRLVQIVLFITAALSYGQSVPSALSTGKTPASSQKRKEPPGENTSADSAKDTKPDNDGLIAEYTRQLANYTSDLATYTKILVIIGVLQFLALSFQAFVLIHHSKHLSDSVRRTGQIATAVIESQRPRIAAKAHGNPIQTLESTDTPRLQMELINLGATAALGLKYETWVEVLQLPFRDFTALVDHFESSDPVVLFPNHSPLIINIPLRTGLTQGQLNDLRSGQKRVCLRIRARFRDAFTPERTVNFGFVVAPDGLEYLPKYNEGQ